ncbi:MAG: hypothetical protein HOA81_12405 [Opitutales bacterium]|nr:hypothetical protein [Opitutales bacterium]
MANQLPELPADAKRARLEALSRIKPNMRIEEKKAIAEANFHQELDQIAIERPKPTIDTGKIYQIATQAIKNGLNLYSVMAFIREERETECFASRFVHGDLFKPIRNRPFVSDKNGTFSVFALTAKKTFSYRM